MSEITLTGGTLVPNSSAGSATTPNVTANNQHHEHNHGHHHHGGHNGIEMARLGSKNVAESLEVLVSAPEEEISRALSTLMRFGRYESFPPILEKLEEKNRSIPDIVLKQFDQGGHTLFHWAAKRVDDLRFLSTLVELATKYKLAPEVLNIASKDNVGMKPIHWACTEGSIPHAALLVKNGADLEARDNSGCTPLLIAAQYGQVEVVAYLLKIGANIMAVDSSRDTALHWAAYKGSIEVCGLLTYFQNLSFATQDTYGQTPLHLSALRGHTSVVRWIVQNLDRSIKSERDILFVKDKNERTPLDLAIHKNRPTVEVVLKEAMANAEDPRGHFFRKTLWNGLRELCSVRSWKKWMGLVPRGMDEMDTPTKMPFYFVIVLLMVHFMLMVGVFAPFADAGGALLWDKSGLLMVDFVTMLLTWYFYAKTVRTSPGYVDESMPDIAKWRQLYEDTIESLADETTYEGEQKVPKERPFVRSITRQQYESPIPSTYSILTNLFYFFHYSNSCTCVTLHVLIVPNTAGFPENASSFLTTFARLSTTRSVYTITNIFTFFSCPLQLGF